MSGKLPSTAALRELRRAGIRFRSHSYQYQERGGAQLAAEALGLPLHQVIKTIVLEDEHGRRLMVLMHGDLEISTKRLARALGVKRITPCSPVDALRTTGYRVGGTSPIGSRTPLPVYVEETVAALGSLYINGGARGLLLEIETEVLLPFLRAQTVRVAIPPGSAGGAPGASR